MLNLEYGFCDDTIIKAKKNLMALGFISEVYCSKKYGSSYHIETDTIIAVITKLNACTNRVERLKIANDFRVERLKTVKHTEKERISKGITKITDKRIKKYTGKAFDINNALSVHNKERYEPIPEDPKEKRKKGKTGKEPNPEPNKEEKPLPQYALQLVFDLNKNEEDKRNGNDMYYLQTKEAKIYDFKRYFSNDYELIWDGQLWSAKNKIAV
jgi:hypothetical protein